MGRCLHWISGRQSLPCPWDYSSSTEDAIWSLLIHTHPGLGVFLSGTDFSSFKYLTSLSPDYLAVVVDPLRNDIIGYNGELVTRTSEVPDKEPEDESHEKEEVKEPVEIKEFKEIEVEIVRPDLSNEVELAFLKEFRQVIQSKAASKQIGDTEQIHAFIPIEDSELKLNTMAMKVDYLESQLALMETRLTYSTDIHPQNMAWLSQYALTTDLDSEKIDIPRTFVVKPEGILYVYNETPYRTSAKFAKWEDIESVEGLILVEQSTTTPMGYPANLQVILLNIGRRKSGLFSKRPKDLQILLMCIDSKDLFRALIEYMPTSSFYKLPPKKKKVKKEDEEVDEAEKVEDTEEEQDDGTEEEVDAVGKDEDYEFDVDEEEIDD
jgi:proteasome lid subunit RPN8/RPN11